MSFRKRKYFFLSILREFSLFLMIVKISLLSCPFTNCESFQLRDCQYLYLLMCLIIFTDL